MSHATGAQPATQPAANPLSTSEPWNLVADGHAETTVLMFEEFANLKSQFVTSSWGGIRAAP